MYYVIYIYIYKYVYCLHKSLLFSTHLYLTRYMTFVRYTHTIKKGEIIPITKKFGCVGRGDLTLLFFLKVVK